MATYFSFCWSHNVEAEESSLEKSSLHEYIGGRTEWIKFDNNETVNSSLLHCNPKYLIEISANPSYLRLLFLFFYNRTNPVIMCGMTPGMRSVKLSKTIKARQAAEAADVYIPRVALPKGQTQTISYKRPDTHIQKGFGFNIHSVPHVPWPPGNKDTNHYGQPEMDPAADAAFSMPDSHEGMSLRLAEKYIWLGVAFLTCW